MMRHVVFISLTAFWVAVQAFFSLGQSANDGFGPFVNSFVYSIAVAPDGKTVIGGTFGTVGNPGESVIPRSRVARLDLDGRIDTSFPDLQIDDAVNVVAVQPDGKILVGGNYTQIAGGSRSCLARLHSDGTLDTSFAPQPAYFDEFTPCNIYAIALQADGRILVAGSFSEIGNAGGRGSRSWLARLNSDGTLDTTFADPMLGNPPLCISIQPDGKVLIGGYFTQAGGQSRKHVARLRTDGTLDTTFGDPNIVPFGSPPVKTLALQPDGRILIAGYFAMVGGQVRNSVARLNPDGSLDAFNPAPDQVVLAVTVEADGRILIGGSFSSIAGQTSQKRLVRFNQNGDLDTTFAPNPNVGGIFTIVEQQDGKLLTSGTFTNIAGENHQYLARILPNGQADTTLNPAPDGPVYALAVQPDGKILVGGGFTNIAGASCSRLARLHPDGSLDTGFGDPGANGAVYSLALQADGKILVGGAFTLFRGSSRTGIVRLNPDGTLDNNFTGPSFLESPVVVNAVAVGDTLSQSPPILIGGSFSYAVINEDGEQVTGRNLARLTPAGTLHPKQADVDGPVYAIAARPGLAIIGGDFTKVGETFYLGTVGGGGYFLRNNFAAVSAEGAPTSWNPSPNQPVTVLADLINGLYVGGYFTSINDQPRQRMALLTGTNTIDPDFAPSVDGAILSIISQADGDLLIGGLFNTVNGQTRNRIARLAPGGALDSGFAPAASDNVLAMALQKDGKLIAGGAFNTVAGRTRPRLARLTNNKAAVYSSWLTDQFLMQAVASGSGPRLRPFNYQFSTDGINYISMPVAKPVDQNFYVRTSGYQLRNSPGAAIEFVRNFYIPSVTVSGRVLANGRGVRNAQVTITGPQGFVRNTVASPGGRYHFTGVPAGGRYTITATSARFQFAPKDLIITGELTGLDFTAQTP